MKRLLFALPLLALAACGGDKTTDNKDVLMQSDFDTLLGWLPDPAALAKDKAHSGTYSLKVDQGREFSPNYVVQLGQLSSSRIRGVRVEGWAYLTDKKATASLAIVVKDGSNGKELAITYVDYGKIEEVAKWVPFSQEVVFPAAANYNSQLLIYLWRSSAQSPAYLDDLKVTALH